jgi:mannose-6-phosphate isomerase-like protein (cupin superfamily)
MNRVVTGYDDSGRPAILRQGEPPVVIHAGRYTTTELWVSDQGPLQPTAADASTREWALEPPPGGACFRIVEIAPATGEPAAEAEPLDAGHLDAGHLDAGDLDAGLDEFQDAHATDTLDYVTILRGHVTLVVGDAEVTLGPGDSVVQQPGVPHDWQNRGEEPAVMVGVLISAR